MHSGRTNHWYNQSQSPWSEIGQEPARNTDMVKSYGGNDFVHRYVLNEHETNSMKKHIDKSQEVSSIIVELNRNKYWTNV